MAEIEDLSTTDASNTGRFPEGQTFSSVNNGARALEGMIARWYADTNGSIVSSGTDTVTLSAARTISAYAQGQVFIFEAGGTNTGAVTLNIDSVGAKAVVKRYNVALAAGDIVAGQIVMVAYEASADNFQLLTPPATSIDSASLATSAETNTGTDATQAVTPDGLAGSNYGTAIYQVLVFSDATDCATGDGAGDIFLRIPSTLNGFDLVGVAASCQTAGTTGTMDIQIHNVTQAADMLTTKITIDSGDTDSSAATTPAAIDTNNDDVATGDQLRIDVDAVHTTAAKGLLVEMQFRLP